MTVIQPSQFYPDLSPPVIVCPQDITVRASAGLLNASVTWVEPKTSGPVFVQSKYDSGHRFDIGRHAVIYTATDEAGNEGQCFFYVTVEGKSFCNGKVASILKCFDLTHRY